jgi:predicted transcriptional regulator
MIGKLEKEVDMLERHMNVLKTVIANEPIGIVKTSTELGYPHHKVRYSLRILEEAELIEPTAQGAVTTDEAELFIDTLNDDLNAAIDRLHSMKTDTIEISP